ncbi:hypothetical protein DW083_19660 [Parabacteroides sp. AF48-14]|uniref:DUF1385 domain-containing protein n=1 Tax=Parabacteroides sp. AF48-14 TaxID=2292052 RepID=UPI000EFFD3A8|nr:DUF6249 domain-containing protein [Parabacteroides sp. AF48-14]RHO66015.1 hypothetical protein DW083_19660 [Parabacteroides sp. AF48-14]
MINHLIPIIVLTVPFIFVIFMVWIKSNENQKRNQLKAELYVKALEKGEKFPEDLIKEPSKKYKSLKTAILLISIGIGISIFQLFNSNPAYAVQNMSVGLIPLILGIGFLIIHVIWEKHGIEDED